MHFVFLNAGLNVSGAELLLFRWARHLAAAKQRVTAVMGEPGPLAEQYRHAGIELTREFNIGPDTVFICNTVAAAPLVIKAAAHAPTVWWLHEGETALRHFATHPEHLPAFNEASAIIIPSATIRDRIYRSFLLWVPERRVHVVPPGLAPPEPDEHDASMARANDRLQVINVGAITPLKGQADLIRAVTSLPDVPIECVFVGRREILEDEAAALADRSPRRFRFVGELPNAAAMRLVAQADVMAHTSTSECLPLAPLEAGLRGLPLVLSDLPAHEGVWRHGVNCLMYPTGDVGLLAHMLRILAIDPQIRARLGAAARLTAAAFRNDLFLTRLDIVLASLDWPLSP